MLFEGFSIDFTAQNTYCGHRYPIEMKFFIWFILKKCGYFLALIILCIPKPSKLHMVFSELSPFLVLKSLRNPFFKKFYRCNFFQASSLFLIVFRFSNWNLKRDMWNYHAFVNLCIEYVFFTSSSALQNFLFANGQFFRSLIRSAVFTKVVSIWSCPFNS